MLFKSTALIFQNYFTTSQSHVIYLTVFLLSFSWSIIILHLSYRTLHLPYLTLHLSLRTLPLCGRQVVQTPRRWQLPIEYGHPVQNIAIQFAFA